MQIYFACAGGVFLSVLIPALARAVRNELATLYGPQTPGQKFLPAKPAFFTRVLKVLRKVWPQIRPYVLLGSLSLAVALVLLAFLGPTLLSWRQAFIAGYAWDSTLQKIVGKP